MLNHSWRLLLAFLLLLVVVATGVFLYLHRAEAPFFEDFLPGALDDYLPRDTASVIELDVKQLRDKGAFDKPPGKALRQLLTQDNLGLPFSLLGIDPPADIDRVRLIFPPRPQSEPLVLLRGRFDRARFSIGAGHLKQERFPGNYRVYCYCADGREVRIALVSDTLVVSADRARFARALFYAAHVETNPPDEGLKELLATVDRKSALWFAADLTKLGKPSQLPFEAQLRPIFEETSFASGAVAWGDEPRAEVMLSARSEEKAARLETHLRDVVKVAAALAPFTREEYEKLFMQLFANAKITRRGKDITLGSRLGL